MVNVASLGVQDCRVVERPVAAGDVVPDRVDACRCGAQTPPSVMVSSLLCWSDERDDAGDGLVRRVAGPRRAERVDRDRLRVRDASLVAHVDLPGVRRRRCSAITEVGIGLVLSTVRVRIVRRERVAGVVGRDDPQVVVTRPETPVVSKLTVYGLDVSAAPMRRPRVPARRRRWNVALATPDVASAESELTVTIVPRTVASSAGAVSEPVGLTVSRLIVTDALLPTLPALSVAEQVKSVPVVSVLIVWLTQPVCARDAGTCRSRSRSGRRSSCTNRCHRPCR